MRCPPRMQNREPAGHLNLLPWRPHRRGRNEIFLVGNPHRWFIHYVYDIQRANPSAPLRVAIAGMVHGHVEGFFQRSLHRTDIQIVGISEPDTKVAARYAAQFSLDRSLFFTDLEDMLQKTHPQAVLAYTNTFDHRKVVEICARHGIHVMMEKPLAVSAEDAHAIADAARKGNIRCW